MLQQYEPTIKAIISFADLLKVKVNNATINETLQNHPDWPGLLCISDSLNKWNVPNAAGKIEPDKMDELPTPFLGNTNNREHPLVIVTEINAGQVQCRSKYYKQVTTIGGNDFFKT